MPAPLSPRDREWVLSHRRQLAMAAAAADLDQVRRIFEHEITEAEDPAAVSRVLRAASNVVVPKNTVLSANQVTQMEAWTRESLAGRSVLEIEGIREQARTHYREASAAAAGDQDDALVQIMVRMAELRLSTCSSVLAWMRTADVDHYDGRPLP